MNIPPIPPNSEFFVNRKPSPLFKWGARSDGFHTFTILNLYIDGYRRRIISSVAIAEWERERERISALYEELMWHPGKGQWWDIFCRTKLYTSEMGKLLEKNHEATKARKAWKCWGGWR